MSNVVVLFSINWIIILIGLITSSGRITTATSTSPTVVIPEDNGMGFCLLLFIFTYLLCFTYLLIKAEKLETDKR